MSLSLSTIKPPITADQIGRRVFAGDLLLFPPSPAMRRLLTQTRIIVKETFECDYPPRAYDLYSHANFLKRAKIAQQRVNSDECKPLFAAILTAAGINNQSLFWDTLGLRVAPPIRQPQDINKRGFRSHVAAHRDTWGAGFQAQINWWMPLWRLANQRTMGFYPSYWRQPLKNTSDTWSFQEFLTSRKQSSSGRAATYPSAPQALAAPQEPITPLKIKPGELVAFSSAHLHASIYNATSLTRFSLEIRTLNLSDLQNNVGAPNIDNGSETKPLTGLFSSIISGEKLKNYWPTPS